MNPAAIGLLLLAAQVTAPNVVRLQSASAPVAPINAVAGGLVLVELSVDGQGRVAGVKTLRTTPPYEDAVVTATRQWLFQTAALPADRKDWPVLVAALFRPTTFPDAPMAEATDDARPSTQVPFPTATPVPPYPADALGDGQVVLELSVDAQGRVGSVRIVTGTSPFAETAATTARQWAFRPARSRSGPTPSVAYIAFAFRQPVTGPPRAK